MMLLYLGKINTMKKFILPLLGLTLALGSCNMANDDDYKNMAKDMCDCVNKHADGLSAGMREAIIASSKDGANMEAVVQAQVMKDPEQGMKDVEAIMAVAEGVEQCGKDIEKKYKDVYTDKTQTEVEKKLIDVLKAEKGCDFTYALMKIGMKEQGKL